MSLWRTMVLSLIHIYPALTETVSSGMDITVNRVTITEEVEQQRIPYHITYQDSADLYIGEEEMVRQGTEGVKEVTYRVVTVDGEETERTAVSEEVVEPAYNRIIAQGTQLSLIHIFPGAGAGKFVRSCGPPILLYFCRIYDTIPDPERQGRVPGNTVQ